MHAYAQMFQKINGCLCFCGLTNLQMCSCSCALTCKRQTQCMLICIRRRSQMNACTLVRTKPLRTYTLFFSVSWPLEPSFLWDPGESPSVSEPARETPKHEFACWPRGNAANSAYTFSQQVCLVNPKQTSKPVQGKEAAS